MSHCLPSRQDRRPGLLASPPPAVEPSADARVGDVDRQRAAALLTDATAAGYLRLDELDQRLGVVWSATTHRQLLAAQSDLPEQVHRARARSEVAAAVRAAARSSLRPHLASYVGVMVLLVAVWLVHALSSAAWYPWPVWPALGWGIGLWGHVRAAPAPSEPS